jgi:hypothetical protein
MMLEHGLRQKASQLIHQEAFWAILALIGIILMLVVLTVMMPESTFSNPFPQSSYPVYFVR